MNLRHSARASVILAAAAIATGSANNAARAQTDVAYWNFNLAPAAVVATTTEAQEIANLFTVSGGTNATTASMTSNFNTSPLASPATTSNPGITSFTGSTVNGVSGDPAGAALALQGSGGSGTVNNNGNSLFISASTVGFQNIILSYAVQKTATGFATDQLLYTTDGVSFTSFGSTTTIPTSFGVQTFDLSSISGLTNNAAAGFQLVFTGATAGTGNNRIDNVQILGTAISGGGSGTAPEPGSIALLGFGLLPIGAVVRRRISRKG